MAQNFKRRVTLLPSSLYNIQNSIKKFKDVDIIEKADNDTFNKSIICKKTPIKEKKLDPSLLETPIMEKTRLRRISIYSPLSFSEKTYINETPETSEDKYFYNKIKNISSKDKSTRKKITNFTHETFQESDDDDIFDLNICLSFSKRKKINNNENKKINKLIVFNDDNFDQYIFPLFNDKDIFEELKDNINNNKNKKECLHMNNDETSDEEQIQHDNNVCLKHLEEAIDFYTNCPNCISSYVNIKKE